MFVFGTADDVFGMAVRIEENGKAFYTGAAEKTEQPEIKKLFSDLAVMEEGHVASFKSLRSRLSGSFPTDAIWDPEGLAESYLQVTADTHVFTVEAADSRLKQIKTPTEVIDVALQFEKDSVVFFIGMKDILPDTQGRNEIDVLIQAEKQHIQMLSLARKELERTGSATIS